MSIDHLLSKDWRVSAFNQLKSKWFGWCSLQSECGCTGWCIMVCNVLIAGVSHRHVSRRKSQTSCVTAISIMQYSKLANGVCIVLLKKTKNKPEIISFPVLVCAQTCVCTAGFYLGTGPVNTSLNMGLHVSVYSHVLMQSWSSNSFKLDLSSLHSLVFLLVSMQEEIYLCCLTVKEL